MPIYEYQCDYCGAQEERLSSNSEPLVCPRCNLQLTRKVSATSFSLKGGGWYRDGYNNNKETT